ncbi:MAG: ATPase, partial [Streptosporangiaceae bacterium]
AVVLDAPPTGRVVRFLDVTRAMADLAKVGPIHHQSKGVVRLLHSADTAVHVVTLLEDMPVAETLDTVGELDLADLRPGAVLVNRARPSRLPDQSATAAANWQIPADRIRAGLLAARLDLDPTVLDGLVAETVEHAMRVEAERHARARLADAGMPLIELPELTEPGGDGVDLGGVYELAEALRRQGVR